MTIQQYLLILRAHYRVALFAFFITVGGTLAFNLMLPKQYTSSAAVVIDVKSTDQISGQVLQDMMAPSYMATQIDIINSDRVAKEVIKLLGLDKSSDVQAEWQKMAKGEGILKDWLSARLLKTLDVKPSRESNVIYINYTSNDPKLAASLANAFAQAYINVNLDLRLAPARQYAAFFEEQTKAARDKLEAAQLALSNYQQRNGITSSDERLDFETTKLNETSAQLTSVQGQTTDSQSKRLSSRSDTLPEVMQSPLINSLKADVARLEAKLTESNVNLGKNHPQTKRYEVELSTLRAQLSAETRKITTGYDAIYQVGKEREAQLKSALASQKNRVLLLNKQRDELSVMRRDVESAQRSFEAVSLRASQTSIESQVNQTNIAVLNPATRQDTPTKPRVMINVLMSMFFGTLLGVGLALVVELTNRRIRSVKDLADALDAPLLGSVAHTGENRMNTSVALSDQPKMPSTARSIGDILVSMGRLSPEKLARILTRQSQDKVPFGEAAIALNLLTKQDIDLALSKQFEYAYLSEADKSLSGELVSAYKPFSRVGENLRAVRSQLMLRWFNDDPARKSLAVVSSGAGDGRSFIAANLAIVFSQQGQRTLLIDADLRSDPSRGQHALFKLSQPTGLSSILSGRASLEIAQPVRGLPGLVVLPAGAVAPNPQELLGRASFKELLLFSADLFDVILIDTPCGSTFADAEIIAARAGAALLVARKNRSPFNAAAQFSRRLQDGGVKLVGSVLNDA